MSENQSVRDFFSALVSQHLDKASPGARLDFLACNLMLHTDGGGLDKELEAFVGVRPKKILSHFQNPYRPYFFGPTLNIFETSEIVSSIFRVHVFYDFNSFSM